MSGEAERIEHSLVLPSIIDSIRLTIKVLQDLVPLVPGVNVESFERDLQGALGVAETASAGLSRMEGFGYGGGAEARHGRRGGRYD